MSAELFDHVDPFFVELHALIRDTFERMDGRARFVRDVWTKGAGEALQGHGESSVLENGAVFERAAVMLSRIEGTQLPPAATHARPDLVGKPYVATGVSVVVHPQNPHVPTTHMNVRCFRTVDGGAGWFGGGFDLTPYSPVDADVLHWHRVARDLCAPFGDDAYATLKKACDAYFFLKHR